MMRTSVLTRLPAILLPFSLGQWAFVEVDPSGALRTLRKSDGASIATPQNLVAKVRPFGLVVTWASSAPHALPHRYLQCNACTNDRYG